MTRNSSAGQTNGRGNNNMLEFSLESTGIIDIFTMITLTNLALTKTLTKIGNQPNRNFMMSISDQLMSPVHIDAGVHTCTVFIVSSQSYHCTLYLQVFQSIS